MTVTVPEKPANLPLLVSYICTLVKASDGVVLGGLVTLATVKAKFVFAARVPPVKVNTAEI